MGQLQSKKETGEYLSFEELVQIQTWEEVSRNKNNKETDEEEMPRCVVCDPAHPHNLSHQADRMDPLDCSACGKDEDVDGLLVEYFCNICDLALHESCLQIPSKMIHPYHPQHPLTFTFVNNESRITGDAAVNEVVSFMDDQGLDFFSYLETVVLKSSFKFGACTWCGNNLGQWFYRCSICNFSLDYHCVKNFPPLIIQNPKNHHHSLALFPRPLSFPCDVCGVISVLEPSYACYQCNYIVHKSCIDLPRVMKITRHPHRLSHTPYHSTEVSPCRICYKNVDIKYGQYSCNFGDCSYVVHSKCATHKKIWGGGELEWAPEDPKEDIAPFKRVGDDLIEHICHNHHFLRLQKFNGIRDSKKKCEACILPIKSHNFYNCIECDFFLHEVCANLPRKLEHALHNHPLFLELYPLHERDFRELTCSACSRVSCGFKYKCKEIGCNVFTPSSENGCLLIKSSSQKVCKPFQLDIVCLLVPECFTHESHAEHPLFISLSYGNEGESLCQGCNEHIRGYHLHCTICKFAICYRCATIPHEICYKFAEHPLSLCYGESGVEDIYWCEVCEKVLDPTEWFYTNNDSCITIHRECLFGVNIYLKAGYTFLISMEDEEGGKVELKVDVVSNESSSRPICSFCNHHSSNQVYFKAYETTGTELTVTEHICSYSCSSRGEDDSLISLVNYLYYVVE